jgi:hypothetical protein
MATNNINRLVGEFMSLYEEWEEDAPRFAWERLQSLAKEGALAYNEGYGPSFHILVFDGYPHGEFHERLLRYLLDAGFDPFKMVSTGSGERQIPVFGHEGLEAAAQENATSARMLATLQQLVKEPA